MKYIDIKSFVGSHTFSGFSNDVIRTSSSYEEDANVCLFIIDGITYEAMENPDDGYRSSLSYVKTTTDICNNKIPSHFVTAEMNSGDDVIHFIDDITKEIVLSIGTDFSDDYYPSCVMYFNPKKLAINQNESLYHKIMREYKLKRILKCE